MSFTKNDWGDELIDSRDIINRYEELTDDKETHEDALQEAEHAAEEYDYGDPEVINDLAMDITSAERELNEFNDEFEDELEFLESIVKQGENTSDWGNEALINEDYFTEHIKQLIEDCYEMPEEFDSGNWPFNHMEMDWDGAAEEAKVDYITIEAEGETYYIRSA